jgi:hypothetical protein
MGPQGYALAVNGGLFHVTRFDAAVPEEVDPRQQDIPSQFSFSAPRPNPSRDGARYRLGVPGSAHVRVAVYNVGGRLIRVLLDRTVDAGLHSISWDGRDEEGRAVPAGVYFARLTASGKDIQVKGVLLR